MKIGILSDIHGNHFALKEVLKSAKLEGVEKLLILGDIVGYYYWPDEVLSMLSPWSCVMIRGNHERILGKLLSGRILETDIKKKYGSGHRKALEKLTKAELKYLIELPDSLEITIDSVKVMMFHGSPWDADFYLYPDSPKKLLERCDQDCDFVVIGHSHYPFVHRNHKSTLINAGSVGQSRSTGGIAHWTVINTDTKSFESKSTPYNVLPLIKDIEITDPENHYLKEVLIRSKN